MADAADILRLLAAKHSQDVFVPECKDGPTHGAAYVRLDAWAMRRSWAHPVTIGYEIKMSRRDFLADHKWQDYLPYCNEFYFVAPKGVICPTELPDSVGLLAPTTNFVRLLTVKKAPRRDVAMPEDLYRYILICRCRIVRPYHMEEDRAGYWRAWLAEKREERELGHRVSRTIRELCEERIEKVEAENEDLRAAHRQYEHLRLLLREMGVPEEGAGVWYQQQINEAVARAHEIMDDKTVRLIERAREALGKVVEAVAMPDRQAGLAG